MFGFNKKKKKSDVVIITINSDDMDKAVLDKVKDKFKKLLGEGPCPILGISEQETLEIRTIYKNKEEFLLVTIKSDSIEDSIIEKIESELKKGLGHSRVCVLSMYPTESIDVVTIQGEK